jgi:uncharacterized repeat protein (TIGR03803 family)
MICFQRDSRISISKSLLVAAFSVAIAAMTLAAAEPAPAQTYTVDVNFGVGMTRPIVAAPNGDLVQDAAGNLYGTTDLNWGGLVFKLDPSDVLTVLEPLTCDADNGCHPVAGLFGDTNGDLYGTTTGGANTCGTIFKLDTNDVLTVLKRFFLCGAGGASPNSQLVSMNGELYGTTLHGGTNGCTNDGGCGTIFKISKSGVARVLYRITGGADGAYPQSLIRDVEGNLYGVAYRGGSNNVGTVFKFDTAGAFTVLHTFGVGSISDGGNPVGKLTRNSANGSLTGATRSGGTAGLGVVYRVDAAGNETIIHNFFGREGGASPTAGVLEVDGILYGTTEYGGDLSCVVKGGRGCGVLYQIGKTGEYTVLHQFGGEPGDGALPFQGGLTLGTDGSIYGATREGGACCGTIFKYTPASPGEVNP